MGTSEGIQPRPHYGHIVMVFGFFLALCTLLLQGISTPQTIAFGTSEVIALSNQYRTNAGLAALTTNTLLTNSAQAKADHMANNTYFAHDAPDGTTPWSFFASQGYDYNSAGENLALSNQSASSVVDGWYNSPGHRANMMNLTFTEVGYGISFLSTFNYNGTQYNNVYLVAAHYALPTTPTVASAPPATPVPLPEAIIEQATANTASIATETPIAPETPQPETVQPVAAAPTGFKEEPKNTTRSGKYTDLTKNQPDVSPLLTIAGMGVGGAFVIVGSTFELRRLLRHQPFLPKFHK